MAKPGARAGLARALDDLERAERNYEEPELATKAAASAAAAAVPPSLTNTSPRRRGTAAYVPSALTNTPPRRRGERR